MGIDGNTVSISCLFRCVQCKKTKVPAWFLIKSSDEIHSSDLKITLERRTLFLMKGVLIADDDEGRFMHQFNKAQSCYMENHGVGAVVYLRVILEKVLRREAEMLNIINNNHSSKYISFRKLLKEVSKRKTVIPEEFRKDGYGLFSEMSKIVHGERSDEQALEIFLPLRRLVEGVLDTIKNSSEIAKAAKEVGLRSNGDEHEQKK